MQTQGEAGEWSWVGSPGLPNCAAPNPLTPFQESGVLSGQSSTQGTQAGGGRGACAVGLGVPCGRLLRGPVSPGPARSR